MKRVERKIIDLAIEKYFESDHEPDVWFSSNIFMVFGLPTQRLKENPAFWKKETPLCRLTINRDEQHEIPYGCYARMNQIFIDTEIRTKHTNLIDIGSSFNEYVKRVGYHEGYANKALLSQLINYVTCVMKVEPKDLARGHLLGMHSLVAKAWNVHLDQSNPKKLIISKGKILLDEQYATWVHDHCVPLDMRVVECFRRNPLALDFYRFLAYRNNGLNKTINFPDNVLFKQLGTDQQADFVTRDRLKCILKIIQTQLQWPVKAKFEDGHFELQPSPPAIRHKIPSKDPLRIVDQIKLKGQGNKIKI